MSNIHVTSGGGTFFSLLVVLFIGLKLTGHITWPWLWVLAPIWVPLAISGVVVVIVLAVILIGRNKNMKRRKL